MINFTLFKYFLRSNYLVWLGVMAFIMLEFVVVILMMPDIADVVNKMGFGVELGEQKVDGVFALAYVAGLFPMYMSMFPMLFFIFAINKMVSRAVDTTSLSSVLATGIKRRDYLITAAIFVAVSITAMFFVTFIVCGLCMSHWGAIHWGRWLVLNICFVFLNLAVASIVFLCSAAFSATKFALGLGVGIPVVFTIFSMLAEYITAFKYMTIYGWVNAEKLVAGSFNFAWLCIIAYGIIAVTLATASVFVFRKKQLSI